MKNYIYKGCLQPIVRIKFTKGRSNRPGKVAHILLKCGHSIHQAAGFNRGKRMHCATCIKEKTT